ncbi:beta-ketoacyl-ACP synthase II [Desulfovibrio ferrophilus]|uniref:3-oxoacyl-[acyl-carrier-protein] synthase 2 n=1 Tax=Desulfovibrio ferrophilus TaxID=241368 RepID=A0A2Z6B0L9_9BACT|nr:beta-ketoacyl-ACP synthase II [Desulfovibrio ferrophilus]BBD08946.1 beta-ketoacyl synthase [Desulfovibrio ferrophilus]
MSRKRVVITGLSAITPIGNDVATSWKNLVAGVSGVGPVTKFDASDFATQIVAEVKDWVAKDHIPFKQAKRMEVFTQYAVHCGNMLMEDCAMTIDDSNSHRVGVLLGCGLGGLETIEATHAKYLDRGPRGVSPFFIPIVIGNMAPGQVSIFTGARGPNLATTSACASGTHAIGYAFSEILLGRADAMITGGVESTISHLALGGFSSMKAMSTRNDDPLRASRPFERDRDGFVMGEGCGLLMLEELEHAKARGAKIYAEIVGFGASGDAYHMTAPSEDGIGMKLCMKGALNDAGVSPQDVDCINAHGTSTPLNDLAESRSIKSVFGKHAYDIAITANKSMVGHLLGAAGGVEAVFSSLSLNEGVIPGTLNMENPGDECDLDYTANGSVERQVNYVLSNSFGFGGTNASVLLKRFED